MVALASIVSEIYRKRQAEWEIRRHGDRDRQAVRHRMRQTDTHCHIVTSSIKSICIFLFWSLQTSWKSIQISCWTHLATVSAILLFRFLEPSAVCCVLFGFLFLLQLCNARAGKARRDSSRLGFAWLDSTRLGLACCVAAAAAPFAVLFNYAYYSAAATVLSPTLCPLACTLLRSSRDECESVFGCSFSCMQCASPVNASVVHFRLLPVAVPVPACVHFICGLPSLLRLARIVKWSTEQQEQQEQHRQHNRSRRVTKSQLNRTPC